MNFLWLLVMHLAAALGGYILIRLKAPAGAMVGSMLGVVLFFVISRIEITYYAPIRLIAQVLSGLVIGLGFSHDNFRVLVKMVGPVLVLIATMVVVNVAFALLMYTVTDFTFMTSLFATGLGGVADLALIAPDFGADMEVVALLQLFRLVTVVLLFPPLIKGLLGIKEDSLKSAARAVSSEKVKTPMTFRFTITLMVALAGGLLFYYLKVPAGGILGAIFATALLNILSDKGGAPLVMKSVAQILVGAYIGSNLSFATLLKLPHLLLPYLILVAEIFAMGFLGAFLFTKFFAFDWPTALFCAAPGGVQVMGLIGQEYGIDAPKIVLMHTIRIFGTLVFLPILAGILG